MDEIVKKWGIKIDNLIDELGQFHEQLCQRSTLRGPIIQHKQGIQLCYGGLWYQTALYNSSIFWDFNKCLWEIFFQLSFEKFWLSISSGWGCCDSKLKMTQKSPLKVHELKVW